MVGERAARRLDKCDKNEWTTVLTAGGRAEIAATPLRRTKRWARNERQDGDGGQRSQRGTDPCVAQKTHFNVGKRQGRASNGTNGGTDGY